MAEKQISQGTKLALDLGPILAFFAVVLDARNTRTASAWS